MRNSVREDVVDACMYRTANLVRLYSNQQRSYDAEKLPASTVFQPSKQCTCLTTFGRNSKRTGNSVQYLVHAQREYDIDITANHLKPASQLAGRTPVSACNAMQNKLCHSPLESGGYIR